MVVEPTHLKNMSSSIGMMTFPVCGKIKKSAKPPEYVDQVLVSQRFGPIVGPYGPLAWLWRIVSSGRSPPGCSKKWFQRLATAGLAPGSSQKKMGDATGLRPVPVTWVEQDPFIRPVNEEALLTQASQISGAVVGGPNLRPSHEPRKPDGQPISAERCFSPATK